MVTVKSYTDIEQSKKLADILPLESADMKYYIQQYEDFDTGEIVNNYTLIPCSGYFELDDNSYMKILPAWSLAALLSVLPDEISTGEGYQNKYEIDIRRHYGGNNITLYQIAYGNNKGSSGNWHDIISTSEQEKFVNVCYEMIIYLHEQNLL